jgi:hypothetical protein
MRSANAVAAAGSAVRSRSPESFHTTSSAGCSSEAFTVTIRSPTTTGIESSVVSHTPSAWP